MLIHTNRTTLCISPACVQAACIFSIAAFKVHSCEKTRTLGLVTSRANKFSSKIAFLFDFRRESSSSVEFPKIFGSFGGVLVHQTASGILVNSCTQGVEEMEFSFKSDCTLNKEPTHLGSTVPTRLSGYHPA